MLNIQFTKRAISDLEEIWNYTSIEWSERQADLYYNGLLNTCQVIAKNPKLGKRYDEISQGLMGFPFSKHIIFFTRGSKSELLILRILHSNMDLKNKSFM